MLWFSSDLHFGHKNILRYCPNRAVASVDEMNARIVKNFHAVMAPDDILVLLGDVALGDRTESLKYVGALPGAQKILRIGNHDAVFAAEKPARQERFMPLYEEQFDLVVPNGTTFYVNVGPYVVKTSHFPYDGDSHDGDRYDEYREEDDGMIILHGHTHSTEKISRSKKGSLQIHVGVDAWDMYPVPETELEAIIRGETGDTK